ncbi:MAG: hypothetical protein AAB393_13575, partial [Bacteroidota bacterium]
VAAEGTSWESPVARKFENAVWYLIVDRETNEKELYQNLPPHDHNNILVMASRLHASTVITGWVNTGTAKLMQSLGLRLAAAHQVNVREALGKLNAGELEFADLTKFRQGLILPGALRRGKLVEVKKGSRSGSTATSGSTPRGHHHLQQYGGRGH